LRVITTNVNGIRAAARKGGLDQLHELAPTLVCIQEVRATPLQCVELLAEAGFGEAAVVYADCTLTPGRNGVAIVSTHPMTASKLDLPGFAGHGRWIEMQVDTDRGPVTVISTYVPKGGDANTLEEKRSFLKAATDRMNELVAAGNQAIVAGDINVAHTEMDLKNWRNRVGKSGFLTWEKEFLTQWQTSGWVDVGRSLTGDQPGPYTWWSQRGRAYDNDVGWRIDYVWATSSLAATATATHIPRAPTWDSRWSDHAPVVVDFGSSVK